jgi:hypothetical protein
MEALKLHTSVFRGLDVGGRPTIRPPANPRSIKAGDVLGCGIDTLYLSLDVTWEYVAGDGFWADLDEARDQAEDLGEAVGVELLGMEWAIRPHGIRGYRYILEREDCALVIADRDSKRRPNVRLELRSIGLWAYGYGTYPSRLFGLLENEGATIEAAKVSRVDVCSDVVVAGEDFTAEQLQAQLVTRCASVADFHDLDSGVNRYYERRVGAFTGMQVGRGDIVTRVYDKGRECRKSGKDWFYDVWEIESIPDGLKIIRVEYQLRREAARELEVGTASELLERLPELWSYLVRHTGWRDRADRHTDRAAWAPWFVPVVDAFAARDAVPATRTKRRDGVEEQMSAGWRGYLTTILALRGAAATDPVDAIVGMAHEVAEELVRSLDPGRLLRDLSRKRPRVGRGGLGDETATGQAIREQIPEGVPL